MKLNTLHTQYNNDTKNRMDFCVQFTTWYLLQFDNSKLCTEMICMSFIPKVRGWKITAITCTTSLHTYNYTLDKIIEITLNCGTVGVSNENK